MTAAVALAALVIAGIGVEATAGGATHATGSRAASKRPVSLAIFESKPAKRDRLPDRFVTKLDGPFAFRRPIESRFAQRKSSLSVWVVKGWRKKWGDTDWVCLAERRRAVAISCSPTYKLRRQPVLGIVFFRNRKKLKTVAPLLAPNGYRRATVYDGAGRKMDSAQIVRNVAILRDVFFAQGYPKIVLEGPGLRKMVYEPRGKQPPWDPTPAELGVFSRPMTDRDRIDQSMADEDTRILKPIDSRLVGVAGGSDWYAIRGITTPKSGPWLCLAGQTRETWGVGYTKTCKPSAVLNTWLIMAPLSIHEKTFVVDHIAGLVRDGYTEVTAAGKTSQVTDNFFFIPSVKLPVDVVATGPGLSPITRKLTAD